MGNHSLKKVFGERGRKTEKENQVIEGILLSGCHHGQHEFNPLKNQ